MVPVEGEFKPSWDEYLMAFAVLAASRSTCCRGSVGCVLARDSRILATGYNGPPQGGFDCRGGLEPEGKCRRTGDGGCVETVHAEQNAVAYAARYGVDLTGCTAYLSSYSPCLSCAKLLIQCGCKRVVYGQEYRDPQPLAFLDAAGVERVEFFGAKLVPTWLQPDHCTACGQVLWPDQEGDLWGPLEARTRVQNYPHLEAIHVMPQEWNYQMTPCVTVVRWPGMVATKAELVSKARRRQVELLELGITLSHDVI